MSTHLRKYDIYHSNGKIILRDVEAESPFGAIHHGKMSNLGPYREVVAIGRDVRSPWGTRRNHAHFADDPPTWHFGIRKIGPVRNPIPYMVRLSSVQTDPTV